MKGGDVTSAAPVQGNEWDNLTNVGLQIAELRALSVRLATDFDPASFGHAQFADLGDRERAVVSDETCRSIQAVSENLMELALHERDLRSLVGDGLPLVGTGSPPEDYIEMTRVDLNLIGYFRAFGSALDCLAAAAVAILRAPRNMQLATYANLFDLNESRVVVLPEQRREWERFLGLMERHRRRSPHGWLDWALATRNSVVHRARQLSLMSEIPRPMTALWLPEGVDPLATHLATARFLPHLRRRPWLRDIDDLLENGSGTRNIWLEEAATVTLAGLTAALNVLFEDAARLLHDTWLRAGNGRVGLRFPGTRSAPRTQAIIAFAGFEPGSQSLSANAIFAGPYEAKRGVVVNRLRALLSAL